MEKFIQKFLICRDMTESSNFVISFPIITVNINGQIKKLLVYKFDAAYLSNYVVLGIIDDNLVIDRERFINWLKSISFLIHFNSRNGVDCDYKSALESFKNNYYATHIMYTQEGYDLITNKPLFSPTGAIQRTVLINFKYYKGSIEFGNVCTFDATNKVLDNGFFHTFEEYEQNYFLNPAELKTWGDITAIEYARFNINRLSNACKTAWIKNACSTYLRNLSAPDAQNFLLQLLDSAITQKQQEPCETPSTSESSFKI